ncbi:hypothetical protein [Tabrizicola sp.]|uniref:hypothetical protein n=1 Tax=Tabrizicola sp. TaxID=2005166 RepID=UPI0035AFDAD9
MTDHELNMNRGCDTILAAAAEAMLQMGAEPERIVDRALTYGAAQIVSWHGSARAAEVLRQLAENVVTGGLAVLDPTSLRRRQ